MSDEVTLELEIVNIIAECAVTAAEADLPELEIIFGVTVNAVRADMLSELATTMAQFAIENGLVNALVKRRCDRETY